MNCDTKMCDKSGETNQVDVPPVETCRTSQCSSNWLRESIDGSELSWRPSSKYINPGHGYEKEWRSSRARVEGSGVSQFPFPPSPITPDDKSQWRSCIRYIPPPTSASATESDQPRRSSRKHVQPTSREPTPDWKPGVRIFRLSECSNEWKMDSGRRHVQPKEPQQEEWRSSRGRGQPPPSKWIPPFRSITSAPSSQVTKGARRKVPCYTKNHPEFQLFSARSEKPNMSNDTRESSNAREIRAKVSAYFEMHPPLHLFSNPQNSGNDSGRPKNGSYHHAVKRYIPEGHEDHFENVACAKTTPSASTGKMLHATGPQRDSVDCRNVILGNIDKSEEWKPPKGPVGHPMLAPASRYNEDIISNRFSLDMKTFEPVTSSYRSEFKNKPIIHCQSARGARYDETLDPIIPSYTSHHLNCIKENVRCQKDKTPVKNAVKAKEWKTCYSSNAYSRVQNK